MVFSVSLLVVSLGLVSCEKCSETLHDTFRERFNVTEDRDCEDCVILSPGISSEGKTWAGFCSGDRFFLFQDWKCREDNDLLNKTDYFVVGANELCELVEENHALNEECFKKFNSEICSELSGRGNVKEGVDEVSFYNPQRTDTTGAFLRRINGPSSTGPHSTHTTTSNAEKTSRHPPSATASTTFPSSPLPSTVPPRNESDNDCEEMEFFFKDHCYFLRPSFAQVYEPKRNSNTEERARSGFKPLYNATKYCQEQHRRALGLAVETKEENEFILSYLNDIAVSYMVLTSGIKLNSSETGEWRGWNLKIDESVFNSVDRPILNDTTYSYSIRGGDKWFLQPHQDRLSNFFILCERLYNPKNTLPELHKECLKLYRKSDCYNPRKHANFCCAKDDKGEIWFACPKITQRKKYPQDIECSWTCDKKGGFFEKDRPTCKGKLTCAGSYNGIRYVTAATRYAIGDCPKRQRGFSTWYCSRNGSFVGKPDFGSCCKDNEVPCTDTDASLNVWMGCPSRKVSKKLACPPGSPVEEALVEWYCDENGIFSESSPDYSNCNEAFCHQVDRFGTEWKAPLETTQDKNCPPRFVGRCYWKCEKTGKFEGPEPDCSKCKAEWMEKIQDKIKSDSNHSEVMEIMEHYTEREDLRIGYGYVLNLTSDCVTLFKNQVPKNETNKFDKFLKSYSKILKNVAVNPVFWSSFSVKRREEYGRKILNTTQGAAFAVLDSETSRQKYNVTLAKSEADGFDFFVAYSPSAGARFPLENFSESDWHLHVEKINESNPALAAMGLVMSYNLSLLMFPSRIESEGLAINAPAVTFTVAECADDDVVLDPNVVVSISFKHQSSTRFPQTQIIKRRLHNGEQPSGVFNSTVCCYYRNSNWTTEGCWVTFTSKDRTNCTCSHLSTIGLLMTVHKYVPDATLELFSTMGSAITIVSLILALLVFFYLDTVRNERVLIGKNLCFCLLIGHFLLVTVMDKKWFNIPDKLCMVYAVLLHYVFMAAFAWMFVEGFHLYRMLVVVFDSGVEYRRTYLAIGYGMPFLIVVVTALVGYLSKDEPYGQDEFCWLKPPNYVWAFVGPVIITTAVNFCILVIATKQAILSKQRFENSNSCAAKLWLKGWISLSTVLGITWFFGLAYIRYNENLAYAFVFFNGLQGFFIFLFRCLLCEQYKTAFMKKVKSWFWNSKSPDRNKSEVVKSETKLFAVSATKSSAEPGCDRLESRRGANKPEKSPVSESKTGNSSTENSSEADVGVGSKTATSEAYLRNRMISKNFSIRKSKSSWLVDSVNFPELSYHNIYHPN